MRDIILAWFLCSGAGMGQKEEEKQQTWHQEFIEKVNEDTSGKL